MCEECWGLGGEHVCGFTNLHQHVSGVRRLITAGSARLVAASSVLLYLNSAIYHRLPAKPLPWRQPHPHHPTAHLDVKALAEVVKLHSDRLLRSFSRFK